MHYQQPSPSLDNQTSYVAPSFSWASRVCKIRWWRVGSTAKQEVQVVEANCTPRGSNSLSDVSDGFMKLRGRTITVAEINANFKPRRCRQLGTGGSISEHTKAVQSPGILGKTLRNHCIRVLGDMLKNTGISCGSFLRQHRREQWRSFYGLRRKTRDIQTSRPY